MSPTPSLSLIPTLTPIKTLTLTLILSSLTQWELPQWSYCRGLLAALRHARYPPTDPTQPYTPLQQRLQTLRDAMMRRPEPQP